MSTQDIKLIEWRLKLAEIEGHGISLKWSEYKAEVLKLWYEHRSRAMALFSSTMEDEMMYVLEAMDNLERYQNEEKVVI